MSSWQDTSEWITLTKECAWNTAKHRSKPTLIANKKSDRIISKLFPEGLGNSSLEDGFIRFDIGPIFKYLHR